MADTVIKVRQETAEKLRKLGSMGDSYNSVIIMLLESYENKKKSETSVLTFVSDESPVRDGYPAKPALKL